ncbi:MAG: hypothetical protein WBB28_01960 [Crinalium sp.]
MQLTEAQILKIVGQIESVLATPSKFKTWLENKQPGQWVGMAQERCKCPVAEFAAEALDSTFALSNKVEVSSVDVSGEEIEFALLTPSNDYFVIRLRKSLDDDRFPLWFFNEEEVFTTSPISLGNYNWIGDFVHWIDNEENYRPENKSLKVSPRLALQILEKVNPS